MDTAKKEPFEFQVSPADPCMLFEENKLGVCIIIMYVYDMLIIEKKEQIQEFATKIQKEVSVKIQHNLADYLGCEHETYRSGVGTLLYLTKHSRPDICIPVRELSKTMDAPAPVHLKKMRKLIRFVLSTKEYGLKFVLMKDKKKWAQKALSE